MMRALFLALLLLVPLHSDPAQASIVPERGKLFSAGRYVELEKLMEKEIGDDPNPKSAKLMFQCAAYGKLKRYNKLFPCLAKLEDNVNKGDISIIEYVIDKFAVRLLPSASVMKYLRLGDTQYAGGALTLGNPDLGDPRLDLEFAQQEAVAIARMVPQSRAFLRKEANETALRTDKPAPVVRSKAGTSAKAKGR